MKAYYALHGTAFGSRASMPGGRYSGCWRLVAGGLHDVQRPSARLHSLRSGGAPLHGLGLGPLAMTPNLRKDCKFDDWTEWSQPTTCQGPTTQVAGGSVCQAGRHT